MDFHAVVVVGVEMPRDEIARLDPVPYAKFLKVKPDLVAKSWRSEDNKLLREICPKSLGVYDVDDLVDLCFGNEITALAIPLAHFNFDLRTQPYHINRRLAFDHNEIFRSFHLVGSHLRAANLQPYPVKLFTPVTYSAT